MFLSFPHFLFTAERSSAKRPLWLVSRQVPGSIFPCGKNLHPAARAATLTAHILPCPAATPKTEADRQANQPPFPSCHCTGRTAAARVYQTVGFMQGVPPAPPPLPKADSGYAGAEQGGSGGGLLTVRMKIVYTKFAETLDNVCTICYNENVKRTGQKAHLQKGDFTMYAKGTKNYVTFFNTDKDNTEKIAYGRVSEAFKKIGADGQPIMQNGKQVYDFETWNVRLVGKAKEKFDKAPLDDKAPIILTEWAARSVYNKEKKQSYPYLVIFDYDMNDKNGQ